MTRTLMTFVLVCLSLAAPVDGQRWTPQLLGLPTSDAIFDDSVVHEVRLRMNARDWETLKARFMENKIGRAHV